MQKKQTLIPHGSAGPGKTYITGPSFQGPNKAITGQEFIMVLIRPYFPGGLALGCTSKCIGVRWCQHTPAPWIYMRDNMVFWVFALKGLLNRTTR